jgi:hypothetical protein
MTRHLSLEAVTLLLTLITTQVGAQEATAPAVASPRIAEDGSWAVERYVWQASQDGGAAEVRNPSGGVWAYTADDSNDGRAHSRFALGKLQRTEYTLFSAEEETALWTLKQQRLQPPAPAPRHARAAPPHHDPIAWPRVVLRDGSTCVPTAANAEAEDWQQHLVCWDGEARRVQ